VTLVTPISETAHKKISLGY